MRSLLYTGYGRLRNSLTDLQVSRFRVYLENIELGITDILCYINTLVLVILGECFLVQFRSFNGSSFNFRFPGCPALPFSSLPLGVGKCYPASAPACIPPAACLS